MVKLSAVISLQPDLKLYDDWLWGDLKGLFSASPENLAELKACDTQHILRMIQKLLRSIVDHAVFQVTENGGKNFQHALRQSDEI